MLAQQATVVKGPPGGRWLQLVVGIICMAMVANLQYGWTLFVSPMDAKHGWGLTGIQVAFSIFIVTETWLVPIEGWCVDRFGPCIVTVVGGILCGISWMMNSVVDSLAMLYVAAAIGGIGAGAVYGTCVGNALKWFPDRRGLAAGLTAAGFGAGSAITIIPIANMIASSGYEQTFMFFGLIQGGSVFLLAFLLRAPKAGQLPQAMPKVGMSRRDYSPVEMAKTPVFWVMYFMFTVVAAGGLMATAQIGPIAKDYGLANTPISLIGITLPALTFALTIDRILNGVTRPFFGWVSDHIGRENTMFIAFAMEAVGILALAKWGHNPMAFVFLTGMVFFAWGEIFSLFPATCGDTFGSKYAASNAGLLYTAKGTAALLVPISSVIADATGSWDMVFVLASAVNALAAVMALLVLKPMRSRLMEANSAETAMPPRPAVTLAE
ncbi:OFA family oxalate/formate antiporter-like MFS transporter [Skermanella aerolata]|uniref:Oxalate/formate MFS antiporter n=1 Tax=Skermanella aerolata TaxID=393310 RepID=A0A512E037_9PROT|nr:oxalate/formate MFS antiporter [Skermanella aerolata]KJB91342.1 spermidine/putrescine ABC transporter substrate-binding protein [Skermanella aerolata KACC 11604]GEO42108.1 oxalate/formate MFS antiporter [Skermanella aerolata]